MTGEHKVVFQLARIANALELVRDVLENPMQTVNVSNGVVQPSDDLDPTFAALAGSCYSFSDQLDKILNEPDQFKKAQALRNLVTQIRSLADKYAENAAAEDYRLQMQSRIRRVESDEAPVAEPEETPERYKPKVDWVKGGENST